MARHSLRQRLRALLRKEDGAVTIEFLIWFPTFLMIFLWMIDGSILLARATLFERAVDIAIRDVRLGISGIDEPEEFVARVCEEFTMENCEDLVVVQMNRVNTTTWAPLPGDAACSARDNGGNVFKPPTDFELGVSHELMLVRACAVVDVMITGIAEYALRLPTDPEGGVNLYAVSAFVIEPS